MKIEWKKYREMDNAWETTAGLLYCVLFYEDGIWGLHLENKINSLQSVPYTTNNFEAVLNKLVSQINGDISANIDKLISDVTKSISKNVNKGGARANYLNVSYESYEVSKRPKHYVAMGGVLTIMYVSGTRTGKYDELIVDKMSAEELLNFILSNIDIILSDYNRHTQEIVESLLDSIKQIQNTFI